MTAKTGIGLAAAMFAFALAALVALTAFAAARLQGDSVGPSFKIIEPDLLGHIEQAARLEVTSGSWDEKLAATRKRATDYVTEPPAVLGLAQATVSASRLFDPSVRLRDAVVGPDGKVVHPAGSLVNPLRKLRLDGRLILLDARSPAQVSLAASMLGEPGQTRVILTGGNPGKFATETGARTYFDQGGAISRRLGLRELPAVVSQAGTMLRIDTVAPLRK